jgi:hypothetical protein
MTAQEYLQKYGQDPFAQQPSKTANATRGMATEMTGGILSNVGGFAKGIGMSAMKTVDTIGGGITRAVDRGLSKIPGVDIQPQERLDLTPKTTAERRGQITGDIIQHVLMAKATGGLGLAGKKAKAAYVGGQALVGGARTGTKEGAMTSGVAAAIIPPALRGVGRLVSGALTKWTAGLTNLAGGKGARALETIFRNPQAAEVAFKDLKASGANKLLEKNAKTIVNGVSTIKKEASDEFGKALEQLGKVKIPKAQIQAKLQPMLQDAGIKMVDGKFSAADTNILDKAVRNKLERVLSSLNKMKFNTGKDLRDFVQLVDKKLFPQNAKLDVYQEIYNDILLQVKNTVLSAANTATGGKMTAMNRAYSEQMGLVGATQRIFGKVQFKNPEEILDVSNKLEQLFSQKPASVEMINKFLTRIGVDPSDFMTQEAVRQIGSAPTVGTSGIGGGMGGAVKGAVDTATRPMDVARLAQKAGVASQQVQKVLNALGFKPGAAPSTAKTSVAEKGKGLLSKMNKDQGGFVKNPLVKSQKFSRTLNIKDKGDLEYLSRVFSSDDVARIKAGNLTNWRGDSYEAVLKANIVSETPKTVAQQLSGKISNTKPPSNTFYHGTTGDNAKKIMKEGFKPGSKLPADTFRGGGYGQMQDSVSFASTPKEASIFSTLQKGGKIIESKLKPNAKVVKIKGIEDAVDLNEFISYLKSKKVDAVWIGGGEKELVVINPKAIVPVSLK